MAEEENELKPYSIVIDGETKDSSRDFTGTATANYPMEIFMKDRSLED